MLDKNKIWVILSFEFKMGHKAMETTHNINNAFGPGTANECTMQWWFKEFCKKDKDLEDEFSAWPSEGDNDPMRALSKLILLQVCQKLPKTSTILWWFSIWSKLERWKSSIIGASWVDWKKKIIILKCHLPLLCIKIVNHFAIGQWCMMKRGFYRTTSDDKFSCWTEKKLQSISQSHACTKKKKSHGHCLVVCCLSDPLQLWESRRKHYI